MQRVPSAYAMIVREFGKLELTMLFGTWELIPEPVGASLAAQQAESQSS